MVNQAQPTPPTGGLNTNQYDFITNPNKPKKSFSLFGGGDKQRYLILFIAGALILIVIFVIFSLIFGSGGDNRSQLIELAKSQNSLIALTEDGQKNAIDANLQNVTSSVKLVITSDRVDVTGKISKFKDAEIEGSLGSLETTLETAKINGTYDDTYREALKQSLGDYQKRLEDLSVTTPSTSTKDILNTSNVNIQTLFLTIKD
ncbi:MAG: hypothetical protein M3P98_00590 [bacterium]|nr:hypothetical protein [bacterium]